MRPLLSLILVLSLSLPAYGQVRARLDGPPAARVGDKVVLRASVDSEKSSFIWLSASEDVSQIDYEEFDKGASLAIWPKQAGWHSFTLVVIAKDAAGDQVITKVRHRLEITGGPVPPNPPTPPVPPGPNPPAPNVDKWGLIKIARETAPANATERAKVRSNYSTVASQLAAGGFAGVVPARTKLSELNRAAVGNPAVEGHAWNRFAFAISERMDAANQDGTLPITPAAYAQAWQDIAHGLE